MNINFKTVAFFAALSLATASCQKENVLPLSGSDQTMETIQ